MCAVSAVFLLSHETLRVGLRNAQGFSGWVLAGALLYLAAYNLR